MLRRFGGGLRCNLGALKCEITSRVAPLIGRAPFEQYYDEAVASLRAGQIPKAEAAISKALRRRRGALTFDVEFNAGVIRARSGQIKQARRHFSEALRLYPESTHAAYALGSVSAMLGDIAGAHLMFKRDLPVMTGTGNTTLTSSLYLARGEGIERRRDVEFLWRQPANDVRAVYVVVSDSVYFCRYAGAVARSILLNAGVNVHLHVHVINPTDEAKARAQSLKEAGATASFEKIDLDYLTDLQRKTYYSCARFMLLNDLRSRTDRPLLVCDIDQVVLSDIQPILDLGRGVDAALIRFDGQAHNILSLVSATAMLVMPTKGADVFCKRLETDISNALAHPRRLTWHLDQAALAMALLMLPLNVKFGFIPPSMIHLSDGEPDPGRPADTGILWSITNSIASNAAKLDTAAFKKLAS